MKVVSGGISPANIDGNQLDPAEVISNRFLCPEVLHSDQASLSDTELVMSAYEDAFLDEVSPLKQPIHESTPISSSLQTSSSSTSEMSDTSSKKKGEGISEYSGNQEEIEESSTVISTFHGFPSSEEVTGAENENGGPKNSGNVTLIPTEEDPESSNTSLDEYLSAQSQPSSPKKNHSNLEEQGMSSQQPSNEEDPTSSEAQRRYPLREREPTKIFTYETLGNPVIKPRAKLSVDKAGEPRIKRFSIFAISNNSTPHSFELT